MLTPCMFSLLSGFYVSLNTGFLILWYISLLRNMALRILKEKTFKPHMIEYGFLDSSIKQRIDRLRFCQLGLALRLHRERNLVGRSSLKMMMMIMTVNNMVVIDCGDLRR